MSMENTKEQKRPLSELMATTMDKIRDMADSNTIIGQPIATADNVTLIPISRLSFGFGSGGGEGMQKCNFVGGSGAGVKIEPVAFLIVQNGSVRIMPMAIPAATSVDRIIEMVPDLLDKVSEFVEKKKEKVSV